MKKFLTFVLVLLFVVGCLALITGCSDNPVQSPVKEQTDKTDIEQVYFTISITDIYDQTRTYKTNYITYGQVDTNMLFILTKGSNYYPIENIKSFTIY